MFPDGHRSAPRIVVADDDEATATLLEALLQIGGLGQVVAVAHDGREALDLVLRHEPDIALLDVEMPRLRGTEAAAAIRAYRPRTRVILHTAKFDAAVREEARLLGVPLLDKMDAADRLEDVLARHVAFFDGELPRPIEELVLVALERRPEEAVVVVTAAHDVPYYSHQAAALLELPFPPRRLTLDELRRRFRPPADEQLDSRPLFRALAEQRDAEGFVHELRGGELVTIRSRAVAFHGSEGEFLGVAAYWSVAARAPA